MATTQQLANALKALRKALKDRDIAALRRISHYTIGMAAIDNGEDIFYVSLAAYMLAKLITKSHYFRHQGRNEFIAKMIDIIDKALEGLENSRPDIYGRRIRQMIMEMREHEIEDPRYVHDLETKSRTKLATLLYAQGFSLSRAAEITGTHKRDLLQFAGRTLMADRVGRTKPMAERLSHVRTLFS